MNTQSGHNPALYRVVTTHYLIAAFCFVITAILALNASGDLQGHYFHPKLLAITHTAALGWGTLTIFGACYQLIPVILETPLHSTRLAWHAMACFIPGLMFLVYAFWTFDPGIFMQAGSIMLLGGILLFSFNVFQTVKKAGKESIHQEFITTATVWLTAAAIVGVLMVFNFRYPFLPKDHLHFLRLHAHMGFGGWFLLLIIGVSSRLVPMFIVSGVQKEKLLHYSYYLLNFALLAFLADTYFAGLNWKTYLIAGIAALGITFWLIFLMICFRTRLKKKVEIPMWHTGLSFLLLVMAVISIPFILNIQGSANALRYSNLYGSLLIMGWISSLIMGQTFKTLPFIAWTKNYHTQAGKTNIPMPADLYNRPILKAQLACYLMFCLTFYSGMVSGQELLIQAGLLMFLLSSLFYLANVLIVLRHRPKAEELAKKK